MKRILAFILICIICFCSTSCNTNVEKQEPTETTTAHDSDHIEFENPLVLTDDACIRVEVVNFFQELSSGLGTTEKDKFITLKMENKTESQLLVILDQLSINNNGATVFRGSTSIEIASKESIVKYFRIRIDEAVPLNNMADLFQLRGVLTVYRYDLDGSRDRIKVANFYVAEAFASDPNTSDNASVPTELSLGETAKTDMAEFTMTGFEIQDNLKVNAFNIRITEGNGTVYSPDKGMVYAVPQFTIRNTAKENYTIDRSLNFTVDYKDGYLYEMDDYTCYITHETGTWERNAIGTSRGQRPEVPPLMSADYQVFLPAIDLIKTDTEAPLRIIVQLPSSDGTQAFIYRVR